jgi:hypothetical protein
MVQALGCNEEWKRHINQLRKRAATDIYISKPINEDTPPNIERSPSPTSVQAIPKSVPTNNQMRPVEDAFVTPPTDTKNTPTTRVQATPALPLRRSTRDRRPTTRFDDAGR